MKDWDDKIKMQRVIVRAPVGAVSRTCKILGSYPLDKDEFEALEFSSAAVLYQEGGNFDAWHIFVSAVGSIFFPRFVDAMDRWEANRAARKASLVVRDMGNVARVSSPKADTEKVA